MSEASIWQPRTILEVSGDTKSIEERLTAIAGQALFILKTFAYTVGTGALEVHKNGLLLTKGTDWVEQSPTTFSLVAPTAAGDIVVATGKVGITALVDVRDTDIYISNYQAIRDYVGTEITLFAQGKVTHADEGESFFSLKTGEAPGFFVDDNNFIIVPTAGDGSAAWIRPEDSRVAPLDTMAGVIASADANKIFVGAVLKIKDRANSEWDVVLSSGVAEDTFKIVQLVRFPLLSIVLRINGVIKLRALGLGGGGDDTAGWLVAIATGKNIWGFNEDTYRISARLTFNKANQQLLGGFKLLYTGPNTDRLFDLTADNFTAKSIRFDGNLGQVRFALGYVAKDTTDTVFSKCHFQNMRGTTKGLTVLNQQYGLCIDYDTVENINIDTCTFRNLVSVNTTANGGAIEGQGFVGGIVVSTEDGSDPTVVQTFPSFGKISNCTFDKIITELDNGLSQVDRNTFDDADGLRFYGVTGFSERGNFQVSDCHFNQCSKRAVKSAMQGVTVNDITIVADSNVYPMTTVVKAHNNNDFSGIIVHCKDQAKRPDILTQVFYTSQTNENGIKFSNINCPFIGTVFDLICESAAIDAKNVYIDDINCPDISLRAFTQSGTVPNSIDVRVDNVNIEGTTPSVQGVVPFNGGWHFGKVVAKNMDWKGTIGGTIGDLELTIDSGTFAGTGTNGLIELNGNNVGKVRVNATGLSSTFLDTRSRVILLQGDNTSYDHIDVTLNESLDTSKPHIDWMGDNTTIARLDYNGPGLVDVGTLIASNGMEIGTCARKGVGVVASPFLIAQNAATDNIVIGQCTDFRASTAASIRLVAGVKMVVMNAASRSTLGVTQDDTAGNMTIVNSTAF